MCDSVAPFGGLGVCAPLSQGSLRSPWATFRRPFGAEADRSRRALVERNLPTTSTLATFLLAQTAERSATRVFDPPLNGRGVVSGARRDIALAGKLPVAPEPETLNTEHLG